MKFVRAAAAMAATLTTVVCGATSAQAATVHYISSSVVSVDTSSGHGCKAWLQWTGSRSNPYVRTRGESWGKHCLIDLYRKGRQYHSWHLDYEGDVSGAHRMYTGRHWMPDHGYLAKACVIADDNAKEHCGKPW
jgi:hypothetical protein